MKTTKWQIPHFLPLLFAAVERSNKKIGVRILSYYCRIVYSSDVKHLERCALSRSPSQRTVIRTTTGIAVEMGNLAAAFCRVCARRASIYVVVRTSVHNFYFSLAC